MFYGIEEEYFDPPQTKYFYQFCQSVVSLSFLSSEVILKWLGEDLMKI